MTTYPPASSPMMAPPGAPIPAPKKMPEEPKKTSLPTPAKLLVIVPADANVTIDGRATSSKDTVRVFETPALPYGETYFYNVGVQVTRAGQTYTKTEQVAVKAGETSQINLDPIPSVSVASR